MNPSDYAPSDVLNAPALLYTGSGQPLTPYFVALANGSTFTIPTSAITWSISNGSGTSTINGVATTAYAHLGGNGPLFTAITVVCNSGTVYVNYMLNNVIYNVPSFY
jgi:hypothetical protein